MSQETILEKITGIFQVLFDQYDGSITPDLSAADVAQWDSLSHVQLIVMVEQAFNIQFSAAEIGNLENLGALMALVAQKHNG